VKVKGLPLSLFRFTLTREGRYILCGTIRRGGLNRRAPA
jgi:hypothetical protein